MLVPAKIVHVVDDDGGGWAADVVKEAVDAVGSALCQCRLHAGRLVVEGSVEAKLVGEVHTLFVTSGEPDHPTSGVFSQLSHLVDMPKITSQYLFLFSKLFFLSPVTQLLPLLR